MDVSYFEEWDRTNIEVHHGPETRGEWAQRLLKQPGFCRPLYAGD
jgi:hypothetical protein